MIESQTNANETRTIPKMVTIREAAQETNVSEYAIRRMCHNNEIVFTKSGTKFLINFNLFVDFLNGKRP